MTPVTLFLAEPDSGKLLASALANSLRFQKAGAVTARAQAEFEVKRGQAEESARNERRAREFDRRAALVQQLVDQLPNNLAPLQAPMGSR